MSIDALNHIMLYSFLFIFGIVFGSFGNVVIWRLPRGENLSHPGSHCPKCDHAIRWYDDVPLISWLVLRAKCRDCGEPISGRYPLVELLSGVLWLSVGIVYGMNAAVLVGVPLAYLLLLAFFMNHDGNRIPNAIISLLLLDGLMGIVLYLLWKTSVFPGMVAIMAADCLLLFGRSPENE